jgi:hypothetical protein
MNFNTLLRMPATDGALDLAWCQARVAHLIELERDPMTFIENLEAADAREMLLEILKAARLDEPGLTRQERNGLRMAAIEALIERHYEDAARRVADTERDLSDEGCV